MFSIDMLITANRPEKGTIPGAAGWEQRPIFMISKRIGINDVY